MPHYETSARQVSALNGPCAFARTTGITALILLTVLGCQKEPAPISTSKPAPTAAAPVPVDPCAVKIGGTQTETVERLVKFDELRVAAFKPAIELPSEPPIDPNENSFSREKKLAAHRAAMAQVERQFTEYYETFAIEWNTASNSTPGGRLGAVPIVETCHVIEVSGGCQKKCLAIQLEGRRRGAIDPAPSWHCEQGLFVYGVDVGWKQQCSAKVECATGSRFRVTTPGLAYEADRYEMKVSGVFGPSKKNVAADLEARLTELRKGDILLVNGFKSWKWSDGLWRGAAVVDGEVNLPIVVKNEACRTSAAR